MRQTLQTIFGVLRSLRIYYGDRDRHRRMRALYAHFLRPGDLVFDIGSHVGDRVSAFRRLGCRVVAVEPQPALVRVLRLLYGRSPAVKIEAAAIGARVGELMLQLNLPNPTVATGSPDFVAAAKGAEGWAEQRWNGTLKVPMTTLDALIGRHGRPSFVKIDVEGLEHEVLRGLSSAVPALSFEFTTIQRDVARACLARCTALGFDRFNAALGESQMMVHDGWQTDVAIYAWLTALPHAANSGDIYAVHRDAMV